MTEEHLKRRKATQKRYRDSFLGKKRREIYNATRRQELKLLREMLREKEATHGTKRGNQVDRMPRV